MLITVNRTWSQYLWCGLLCLLIVGNNLAQTTPSNGSFENGLVGWTALGSGRAESLGMANFNPAIVPMDGANVGFLSTGPGGFSGTAFSLDGNASSDFDPVALDNTVSFNLFPAVLRFDWNFFSAEQDQPVGFDDFFFVQVSDDVIFGRSSANAGTGVSTFVDAVAGPVGTQTVTSPGATNGTSSAFQFAGWFSECIVIPDAVPGQNDFPIRLLIADQGDTVFDSGVAFDNIRVDSACGDPGDVNLAQITSSSEIQVEQKDGAFIARPALNRNIVADADGNTIAFIAQGDFGGNNPSFLDQVFVFENGVYSRNTLFTGGQFQNVDISPDGRWIVFSAQQTPMDNLEVFRLDNNNGNILQITTTNGCDNINPTVNTNGRRVGFISDCGADIAAGFNADGNREVVIWNNGGFVPIESVGCTSFRPATRTSNSAQHYAFASDCDFTGGNADGNLEIFRFNRTNQVFDQITDTTGLVNLDSVDINSNGGLVTYIGSDIAGNRVIQMWDAGTGVAQMIGNSTFNPIIALNMQPVTNPGSMSFERLDILTGEIIVAQVDTATQVITEVARSTGISGNAISVTGGVPMVHFAASDNLVGQNTDVNPEIFSGRVE